MLIAVRSGSANQSPGMRTPRASSSLGVLPTTKSSTETSERGRTGARERVFSSSRHVNPRDSSAWVSRPAARPEDSPANARSILFLPVSRWVISAEITRMGRGGVCTTYCTASELFPAASRAVKWIPRVVSGPRYARARSFRAETDEPAEASSAPLPLSTRIPYSAAEGTSSQSREKE